eukprot:scaffold8428_cov120-Skeletonema_dohrnii-CCMP3373.AAC.3
MMISTILLLCCYTSHTLALSLSTNPKQQQHFLPNSPVMNAFSNCPRELEPTIIELPEVLPPDFPTGTLYRNGHARFVAEDETPCLHPFDADGMIVAITFDASKPSQVLFRNKFVEG